jgi:hypothetical protein
LRKYKTLPESIGPWCLDSGGFATLSTHGKWQSSRKNYSQFVERCVNEVGNLQWVAPMDYMCEPSVVAKTGLSVREHQLRTIESFLFLRDRLGKIVTPVLQGWRLPDYFWHIEMYQEVGVDLWDTTVGIGSVCRRGQTGEIVRILSLLADEGLRLHAFGVKGDALALVHKRLESADSMAWSFAGRYDPPLPGCTTHKNCANCPKYAEQWRENLLERIGQ